MEFWIITIVGVFLTFFFLLKKTFIDNKRKSLGSESVSYKLKKVLFTPAERSFLGVLEKVFDDRFQIFGKVRVADILTPSVIRSEWQRAFNKISAKHFDYVICNRSDLSIVCAIELNDRTHEQDHRKSRDEFLKLACESANFPLFSFSVRQSYDLANIKEKISAIIE